MPIPSEEDYFADDQSPSTSRASDIEESPIDDFVNVYHSGMSGDEEFHDARGDRGNESITVVGLHKQGPAHMNLPVTDQYTGEYHHTRPAAETEGIPLQSQVAAYHPTGRSDEPKADDGKKSFTEKLTGIFAKHGDETHPKTEPYQGSYFDTRTAREVDNLPIEHQVMVYHDGFYNKLPSTEQTEHSKSIGEKIGSLFKKAPNEMDYPISEP